MTSKRNISVTFAAAAVSLAAAVPATAAPVIVTYSGVVADGFDDIGLFGTANADLAGLDFVAKYTFDSDKGANYGYGTYGGSDNGTDSPLISALLTIGGRTVSVGGSSFAQVENYSENGYSSQISNAQSDVSTGNLETYRGLSNYTQGTSVALPGSLTASYAGPVSSDNFGSFDDYVYDYTTSSYVHETYANLANQYLTINVAGGVPEPATWGLMILGFGMVGGAMRRRVRVTTTVNVA